MAATIRPLERIDLPAVNRLAHAHMAAFVREPAFMEATLLDDPWAPDPLPALVAEDSGAIVGFIGAQARRLTFDGSAITGVNVSQFVVEPERRASGVALRLLRELLSGGQDLTWAEGAPEPVARMWRLLGGDVDHARGCDWMVVLSPGRWLRQVVTRAPRQGLARDLSPVGAVTGRVLNPRARAREELRSLGEVSSHDATGAEVVAVLPALAGRIRLRVEYDEAHLDHMLRHWGSVADDIVCRLVWREGRPIGWYAYVHGERRAGRLIHLVAADREAAAVLAELLADANRRGSAALSGRLEPHLSEALRPRAPAVGLGSRPVFHAQDAELRAVVGSSSCVIGELDSIDSGWL